MIGRPADATGPGVPDAAVDLAAAALQQVAGFALSRPQRERVRRALARLAAAEGGTPERVAATAEPGSATLVALVEAARVGETHWFRDPRQLDALASALRARPRDAGPPVLWIAGCSTGQEVWSAAVVLRRAGVWPVDVVATDISPAAIDAVRAATYDPARERGLDEVTTRRDGTRLPDGRWQVAADIRRRVTARRHGITTDPPVAASAIMCRNVLIYLTPEDVTTALDGFHRALPAGGPLVLGHAEVALAGPGWDRERIEGTTILRRPGAQPADLRSRGRSSARTSDLRSGGGTAVDHRALGEAALAAGRAAQAVGHLRAARYLDGDDPVAAALLGIALDRAGSAAEAARAFAGAARLLDALPQDATLAGGYPTAVVRSWLGHLHAPDAGGRP